MERRRSRLKTAVWLAVELAVFLAVYLGVRAWLQRDMADGPPPITRFQLLDGGRFDLNDYRGRPVLIYFWATWCGICGLERDTVDDLTANWPVLTIAMQSGGPHEIRRYLADHRLDWQVAPDPDGRIARAFGVRGVPAFFILDASGRIRFHETGYTTEAGLRLRLHLAAE